MEQKKLKRIAIIGLPGSGKSTFALQLGNILNIPVYHLDKYVFDRKEKRDMLEFLSMKEALLKEESWIIEGCSFSTFEMRFARADMVIYFHLPRLLCIWRICKRLLHFDENIARTGCLKGINWALITYIWNFDRDKRPRIEELRKLYPNVEFLTFYHSQDAENTLKNIINHKSAVL